MNLKDYLAVQQQLIDRELDRIVPAEAEPPEVLHRAMRYSLFAGGKRIRPILCLEASRAVAGEIGGVVTAACSLELIHTYSLIHDDLPALDNDDYRRGKLTSHKMFGEAMAILTGDALLTLAFEVLANADGVPAERKPLMIAEVARAAGTQGGMIAGQVFDLEGEHQAPHPALLESIHRAKTGAMLRASVRLGALCAGAGAAQLEALTCYGEHVGLAFQIVDDILDVEESSEALGKTAGKDAEQHKITFPAVYGLEKSKRMAEREREAAGEALAMFGERGARLRELADMIVHRKA